MSGQNSPHSNVTLAAYTYAAGNGQLTKLTYGNGDVTQYEYDKLGRITKTTFDNGQTLGYRYNGDGQLSRVKENGGTAVLFHYYTYDRIGRLINSRMQKGETTVLQTGAEYDADNKLTKQSWSLNSGGQKKNYWEGYGYNGNDGLISSMRTGTGEELTLYRDGLRRLSSIQGGIYKKAYEYRDISSSRTTYQVSELAYADLGNGDPLTYKYTYGTRGNITKIIDPIDGTKTYSYDDQQQLVSETIDGTTYSYAYDKSGNILTANTSTGNHTYTYNHGSWEDRLTKYDGVSITYDEIGNPLEYYNGKNWTFTWKNGRQLATAKTGSTTTTYHYDMASGMRLSKKVGSTEYEYYYASGKLMRMIKGDTVMDFFYDHAGQPYAMKHNGTTYYYILNLQGDVVRLVSSTGTSYGTYRYDAWGRILYSTNATVINDNPLRYRGYCYDSETGFYYVSSRYYDPEVGRFLNADSGISGVGGDIRGYNLYSYCMNNPVNMTDPDGNWPTTILDTVNSVNNVVNKVVGKTNIVTSSVNSSIRTAKNDKSNSLPTKGQPGSSQTLNNPDGSPKQKRWYGPDGLAERDRDFNHGGEWPFPHDHEWVDGKRGKEHLPPSPDYAFSLEPLLGTALVGVCTIGIAVVVVDDLTGIGVADNCLLGPLSTGVGSGLVMIFP